MNKKTKHDWIKTMPLTSEQRASREFDKLRKRVSELEYSLHTANMAIESLVEQVNVLYAKIHAQEHV